MSTSETQLTKIDIKPGIVRDIPDYAAQGYFVSCQWARFREGKAEKMGGYNKEIAPRYDTSGASGFVGVPRDNHAWIDLDENKYLAVGTNSRLELFTGGKVYDITPIQTSTSVTDGLTVTSGTPYVIVSNNSHGRQIGDWAELFQATSLGNVKLNGTYEVVSVLSADAFQVSNHFNANLTSTGGGSTQINYLLPTGAISNGFLFGWGGGTWGTPGVSVSAGWGQPRGSGVPTKLRQWSLDNWGEDLIACPRGGRIYTWKASAGPLTRATLISASPSVNNFILIAQPARHLMSFGCNQFSPATYDPLLVRWTDSENYDDWDPTTVGGEAGEFRLKGGNYIVGAEQTAREILIGTDSASHRIKYLGNDFIFGSDQVGSDAGLVSQQAMVDINGVVYFMGLNAFYMYDQKVSKLPCSIDKTIFDPDRPTSLNYGQKEKVYAGHNPQFSEIIWFYPSQLSDENDRYVIYNYLEGLWYDGIINRTTWEGVGVFDRPYSTDPSGNLFVMENGRDADAQAIKAFIESSEFDITDSNDIMFIDRFIPDFVLPDNKYLNVSMKFRKYPGDGYVEKSYTITNQTNQVNMRVRGRRAKIRYSTSALGGDFEVGLPLLGIKPDGKR